jgi:hypothetical protein
MKLDKSIKPDSRLSTHKRTINCDEDDYHKSCSKMIG